MSDNDFKNTDPKDDSVPEPKATDFDFDFDFRRFQNEPESGPSQSPKAPSHSEQITTLLGGIVLLIVAGALVVGLPVMIVQDPRHGQRGLVVWVIYPIVWFIGLGAVRLSHKLFRLWILGTETPKGMPEPTYSTESLVCVGSGWLRTPVRVIVDRAEGMIHFQNCHVPRGFLAVKSQVWFSCRLKALKAVFRHRFRSRTGNVDYLRIITPAGRADLSFAATNYESLCDALSQLLARGTRTLSTDNPAVVHWCVWGAICGMPAGAIMHSLSGSAGSQVPYLVGGALVGAVAPYLVVRLASHK